MSPRDPFALIAESLARGCRRRKVSCFAALGDSFTAGHGCPPDLRWADRLAASLRVCQPGLTYHNLAVDGATSAEVLRIHGDHASPIGLSQHDGHPGDPRAGEGVKEGGPMTDDAGGLLAASRHESWGVDQHD